MGKIIYAIAPILLLISCTPKPPEGMVLVPAGKFIFGTDDVEIEVLAEDSGIAKPWTLDATPSLRIDLPAFFIDRYEVTNEEYWRFVKEEEFQSLPHWPEGRPLPKQMKLPVVYVNWHEAQIYCRWVGGRLPSELEWEKASRGNEGRLYPWGNEFHPDQANVGGLFSGLREVGSLPAGNTPSGISDLIGNVWEWTDSWYGPYPGSSYSAPEYGKRYRVLRGHSWAEMGHFEAKMRDQVVAAQARAAYRYFLPPNAAIEDAGFRCAKTPDE